MSSGSIKAALVANASIAAAKTFGAFITGSASMMAEAIHSTADVVNKIIKEYYLEKDVDSCKLTHNEQYKLFFDRWRELKDKETKWAVYEDGLASLGLLSYTDKKEKADPLDPKGASVPKVKAQVGGSKLREMLANLNSEKD